jgi:hypothetical protein
MIDATPHLAPRWLTIAAIAVLAWELLGCAMYLMQVGVDRATLPADQRAMWDASPAWMTGAYAVAVWTGLAGSILLLLRRKLAEPVLLLSFIAAVVQFSALLIVPALRNLATSDALFLPFVIALICFGVWHFARHCRRRGWLR